MAHSQHVDIVRAGKTAIEEWRRANPGVRLALRDADLRGLNLAEANLQGATLRGAQMSNARLDGANLNNIEASSIVLDNSSLVGATLDGAWLRSGQLREADFSRGHIHDASFTDAQLTGAKFVDASLCRADFGAANLTRADLSRANLIGARFKWTQLDNARLYAARMGSTTMEGVNLSTVEGLATVDHWRHSDIGINCLLRTGVTTPELKTFFEKAGTPDAVLVYLPSLIGALRPLDLYSVFISYSSKDELFANRLYADLQSSGIRCWFAPEDMKIGDRPMQVIDAAIRHMDKLLLVLSEASVKSDWVEHEVGRALEEEVRRGGNVLFPIRIDESVMNVNFGWAKRLRQSHTDDGRHIGDLSGWAEQERYQTGLQRLLRDLKATHTTI